MKRSRVIAISSSIWLALVLLLSWKSLADTSPLLSPDLVTPTPSVGPTSSDSQAPLPTDQVVSAPTSTPSPTPTVLSPDQSMVLRIPNRILVDPRAKSALLPQLHLEGNGPLIVCLDSNQVSILLGSANNSEVISAGNGTGHIVISGEAARIMNSINSEAGSRAFTHGAGISNSVITLRSAALTQESIDDSFCSQAEPSNTRTLTFAPLELALNITKASVRVK